MGHRTIPRGRTLIALLAALLIVGLVPVVSAASSDFEDVPASNVFYADIMWLADAGVTKGCSPTRFCPNDLVTRQQMAAFMHRLAAGGSVDAGSLGGVAAANYVTHSELGTLDAETLDGLDSTAFLRKAAKAADSDKLDGLDSTAFLRKAAKAADSDKLDGKDSSAFLLSSAAGSLGSRAWGAASDNLPDATGTALATTLTAPAKGLVILGATVDVTGSSLEAVYCDLNVGTSPITGTGMWVALDPTGAFTDEAICSSTGIVIVDAGTYDFSFFVYRGSDTAALYAGTMWAVWVPFDGTGAVPASLEAMEVGDSAGKARP
jgi:hypothetical protein